MKFALGEFLFRHGVLYRIAKEIHGFRLGDSVTWASEDSNVPCGCVGIIAGAQNDKLIVDFGARQYLLESTELHPVTYG